MDNSLVLRTAGHVLVATLFAVLVFAGYRGIKRRSHALGTIVALGILGRAVVGLCLFTIAYLELPVAKSLQLGGGFWTLAADATLYYAYALRVMEQGLLSTDYFGFPSPFFVQVLAIWMWLVGVSPAAGLFLNIGFYVAASLLIVRIYAPVNEWRKDLPCVVAIGAYSFSPIVFIHATQILKDDFFYLLIAVVCVSVLGLSRLLVYGDSRYRFWAILGGTTLVAATVGLSSIRWYFPVIIWCALACMCLLFVVRGRATPLPRYLLGSASVLVILALAAGARPNRQTLVSLPSLDASQGEQGNGNDTSGPSTLGAMAHSARTGFLRSAGDTNIVVALSSDPESQRAGRANRSGNSGSESNGTPDVTRAIPRGLFDHVQAAALGLAVLFVPISLLKAVSLVDFSGGRSLLPIADLDTIFIDAAILVLLATLWTRRRRLGDHLPFVIFALILSSATAVLLGYVVTNYGTLIRMRPMIAIPLWVLVIALSPRVRGQEREPSVNPS